MLFVDDSNDPYVSFEDNGSGNKPMVMEYTGGAWTTVGGGVASSHGGSEPSMTVSSGDVYVASYDQSDIGIQVDEYNGSSWSQLGSEFGPGASYPSVQVYGGTPYVAYQDGGGGGDAAMAVDYVSGAWATVGAADFSAGSITYPTLSISQVANGSIPAGTPYVAYEDGYNSENYATVMAYVSGAWATIGNASFSGAIAVDTDIFVDPSTGTPYVSFIDGTGGTEKATVMECSGCGVTTGTWTVVGSRGFSSGEVATPSLYVYNGTPYVGFQSTGDGETTVMEYTGAGSTGWVDVGSPNFSSNQGTAQYTSLSVAGGIPYLAYMDGGNSDYATLMEYH